MKLLIAGCGYVGSELARRYAERGEQVFGLRRSPLELTGAAVSLTADLTRPETLKELPPGLELVVYACGAERREPGAYRAAYVDGLGNLLGALLDQGQSPRRVIFLSSTSVYGQDDGSLVDETTPARPAGFAGALLLDAENLLSESPLPSTVLRLAGIYGPGRESRIDAVLEGRLRLPRRRGVFTNRIHRTDIVAAIDHIASLESPEPLYLGADTEPADRRDFLEWLARRLGVTLEQEEEEENEPAAPETARGRNKRVSSERLRASGFHFVYPTWREGYEALIEARGL